MSESEDDFAAEEEEDASEDDFPAEEVEDAGDALPEELAERFRQIREEQERHLAQEAAAARERELEEERQRQLNEGLEESKRRRVHCQLGKVNVPALLRHVRTRLPLKGPFDLAAEGPAALRRLVCRAREMIVPWDNDFDGMMEALRGALRGVSVAPDFRPARHAALLEAHWVRWASDDNNTLHWLMTGGSTGSTGAGPPKQLADLKAWVAPAATMWDNSRRFRAYVQCVQRAAARWDGKPPPRARAPPPPPPPSPPTTPPGLANDTPTTCPPPPTPPGEYLRLPELYVVQLSTAFVHLSFHAAPLTVGSEERSRLRMLAVSRRHELVERGLLNLPEAAEWLRTLTLLGAKFGLHSHPGDFPFVAAIMEAFVAADPVLWHQYIDDPQLGLGLGLPRPLASRGTGGSSGSGHTSNDV